MLSGLSNDADFVIINAPPVLAGADILVVAELADVLLLVVDRKRSGRLTVRAARRELGHVHEKVIGCVLDGVGRPRRLPVRRRADGRSADVRPTVSSGGDSPHL